MPKGNAIQLNDPTDTGDLFDLKISIKRDSEGKIVSGLCIGPVTEQNQALLLLLAPGESKEYPTAGVDIEQQILDDDLLAIRHSIRRNFALDGLQILKLELYDISRVQIQSKY